MHSTSTDGPVPSPESPKRSRMPWLIAGVSGIVAAIAIVGVLIVRDDDSTTSNQVSTGQLASIRQACTRWHDTTASSVTQSSNWCDSMVDWMTGQQRSGQMMGPMMWGGPDQMRDACRQWSTTPDARGSTAARSAWCDQMVDWMRQHMGNWDDWMRSGSMMR